MKLSIVVEQYLEDVCEGKDNETPAAYCAKLHCLIDYLNDRELKSVTPHALEGFKKHQLNRHQKKRGGQVINEKP